MKSRNEDEDEHKDKNILLVEPVPYNINLLKENTTKYKNITIETSAVSEKNEIKKFYYVKHDAVKKLGKHWASGIGSFDKQHILNHKYKRFMVTDIDIEEIDVQYLTFSNLIEKYSISSIDLLQIDVEGAEFQILNSINFEKIEIKKIIFETDRPGDVDYNKVYTKLNECGFKNVREGFVQVWVK